MTLAACGEDEEPATVEDVVAVVQADRVERGLDALGGEIVCESLYGEFGGDYEAFLADFRSDFDLQSAEPLTDESLEATLHWLHNNC